MRGRPHSIAGQRFGWLVAVEVVRGANNCRMWHCLCDCGGSTRARSCDLKQLRVRSCGCYQRCVARQMFTTHGMAVGGRRSPELETWQHMLSRCYGSGDKRYKNYGGRGIRVCERWRVNCATFLADMGRRPTPQHSLDRIDNDGDYTPENCRWATRVEQRRNRRDNRRLVVNGETKTMSEWCAMFEVPIDRIRARLKLGWPPRVALTAPKSARLVNYV